MKMAHELMELGNIADIQLTREEAEQKLRSRSQTVTLNRGHNIKYLPYAFTEHGAIMAATVLSGPRALFGFRGVKGLR